MGSLDGKVCLVTGATSGIGRVAARELARLGATVVVTARDRDRAGATLAEIRDRVPGAALDLLMVDFASQQSIRQAAAEFCSRYGRLHVLLNNAGIMQGRRTLSADGLELTFAVNHIGYFLLTNLLLDRLRAGAPSRVINVASRAHVRGRIDWNNLQGERRYSDLAVYSNSKLMNILFTYELARRLAGTGITANAVHPGTVATRWGDTASPLMAWGVRAARPFALTAEQGAQTLIYLAASPAVEGVSGKYWYRQQAIRSSSASYDAETARRLWEISARLCGLAD